jgi:hypothetical protein
MTLTARIDLLNQGNVIAGLTGGGTGTLDGISTVDLAVGVLLTIAVADEIYFYQLQAGTDAESSPSIIRPDDYAGTTNEKVWKRLALAP